MESAGDNEARCSLRCKTLTLGTMGVKALESNMSLQKQKQCTAAPRGAMLMSALFQWSKKFTPPRCFSTVDFEQFCFATRDSKGGGIAGFPHSEQTPFIQIQ